MSKVRIAGLESPVYKGQPARIKKVLKPGDYGSTLYDFVLAVEGCEDVMVRKSEITPLGQK